MGVVKVDPHQDRRFGVRTREPFDRGVYNHSGPALYFLDRRIECVEALTEPRWEAKESDTDKPSSLVALATEDLRQGLFLVRQHISVVQHSVLIRIAARKDRAV